VNDATISVVIPTFDRCASVQRSVESLARQTLPPDTYEVVVSIDGSDDGTRDMLANQRVPFTLRTVWQPNRGRAAARNAGVREARGRLVVFLDDDMEATPGLLSGHLQAHPPLDDADTRRAVIGAAPIIVGATPPVTGYLARRFGERLDTLSREHRTPRFTEAYTGNFSVPRATLIELGGFDETFRLYGNEDYEFALRLLKAGVELTFSSAALAYQHQEKDFPAVARDAVARGTTAVQFARKHPEVKEELRLGAFGAETWKWRLLRAALLKLSRASDCVPLTVISVIATLERRQALRLDRYYSMALDYFYWVGAQAALRGEEPRWPPDRERAAADA